MYTRIPAANFPALVRLISELGIKYYNVTRVGRISVEDQLLLCLSKLKLGTPDDDSAFRFAVSRTTVQNVLHSCTSCMRSCMQAPW